LTQKLGKKNLRSFGVDPGGIPTTGISRDISMEERIERGTLACPLWTISEILICAIFDGYQAGGTRTEIQIQSLFHTKVLNKDPQITLLQHLIELLMARAPHLKKSNSQG